MDWWTGFDKKMADYLPDLKITEEEPMSRHTSFHIGGPARRMAFPATGAQMVLLMSFAEECGARPLVIGKGTNLLCPDEGLDRLVVETSGLSRLEMGTEPDTVLAEAGVSLARLADFACKAGLTGLEFAHGIPGSVGGGVCMNAGAYGGEMKQVVSGVSVLFPEEGVKFLSGEEMNFGYRHSLLTDHPEAVVLHALFRLTPGDPETIREQMRDLASRRKASQPLEWPSAGSTFKRPEGYFAGTLIDQCGLKGLTVGGAQVSEKHAGFVINRGGATCADVEALIRQIQERVQEQAGVRLEPEVKILRG
ncbi:UDP-N-acetylmuramate dehydrogenase [Dysosmobacter sp.]|uniref:UDP-N-acetylmuramate dehydrogenase n=1 Tax=Dysosmobacter sp. TaxID=2591382 RepID=UPI003A8FABD1